MGERRRGGLPDLVVLKVLERDFVEPFKLLEQVALDGEDDGGAVEPDGVLGGVHADDVPRELEDSFGFLILGHDGAEVGHGLAVLVRVGNGCKGVRAAVVLGNGNDVFPLLGVAVFAHRGGCQNRMRSVNSSWTFLLWVALLPRIFNNTKARYRLGLS